MAKPLTKVKIQPGSTVPCEQRENIERFHVKRSVRSNFSTVENRPVPCERSLKPGANGRNIFGQQLLTMLDRHCWELLRPFAGS